MSDKCINKYPNSCKLDKYHQYDECILHCTKKTLSSLSNPYFKDYNLFFNSLIEYILENALFLNKDENFTKENLIKYFSLTDIEFEELKNYKEPITFEDQKASIDKFKKENTSGNPVDKIMKMNINKKFFGYFQNNIIVFSRIHFPNRDNRDVPNYEYILKKLGKIHFNYCSFYIPYLDLENIECFFQDCNFYEYWSLKNFKVLQKQDDFEVYQACTFYENVSASSGEKDKFSLDNVQFNGCTFKKELTFENINARKPIFKDWNEFSSTINELNINNCSFENKFILKNYTIENLFLKNTIFKGKLEFTNNTVTVMDVDNCNFEKLAEFYGSTFKQFKIFKSIFTDYTGFEKCEFGINNNMQESYIANFQYVTFLSFINFRNTKFKSGLMFEDTNLKEYPNFLNSDIEFENTSKETYRIIKYSFDKLGNHIEANKYFAREMKKYKNELSKNCSWSQERFIFWFNETISNYGQNYFKPTLLLLLSSFLYTLLILLSGNLEFKNWLKEHTLVLLIIKFLNSWFSSIIIFNKVLPKNLEFITVLFAIFQSTLIWHILVAVRRHAKR
ncbi:hypothetical protein [Aliarcobacter cryaerophilus]|uniref:hypothetical protein n=1 Tax=Aliarcobacter cryaerophilus TaxID=28198 RepID=UPI003DA3882C